MHTTTNWHAVFVYKNGNLFWLTGRCFGQIAGGMLHGNTHCFKYQGKQYTTARVIYEMHNGPLMPKQQIGYKDGDKNNRKIENLEIIAKEEKTNKIIETRISQYEKRLEDIETLKATLDMNDPMFIEDYTKLVKEKRKLIKQLEGLQVKIDRTENTKSIESLLPGIDRQTPQWESDKAAALAQIDSMFKGL